MMAAADLLRAAVRSAAAGLLLYAACHATSGFAQAAKPGPIRITAWVHDDINTAEYDVIRQATESFNRRQKRYQVEVFSSIYRNYEERVRSGADSGTLPCLLEFDGPFLYAFAWPGYLQPIDRFVSSEMRRDFLPSILAQGSYGGHLYSLGQFDSGLALWANRRYLLAAGVRIPTLDAPWTLNEFEQALARLAHVPGVEYPLSLNVYNLRAYSTYEFYTYAFSPILQGFGGDLIDRRTYRTAKGVLDGPQSVAAMRHFQQWFDKGWSKAVFDRQDDFETGRTALSWTGHWKYRGFRDKIGHDLLLLPLPDFGHGVRTGMGSWNWGITSACKTPEGAWAFLAYLLEDRQILRLTAVNGAVPARRSALAKSPLFGPGAPLQMYAQQLERGQAVPRPATPAYGAITREFAEAVRAIIQGADVQMQLSTAAERIDADIAAHRGYPPL